LFPLNIIRNRNYIMRHAIGIARITFRLITKENQGPNNGRHDITNAITRCFGVCRKAAYDNG